MTVRAFYSPDGKMIVYRGSHLTDPRLVERDKDIALPKTSDRPNCL